MTNLPSNWLEAPLVDICDILDFKRVPINSKDRKKRIEGSNTERLYPYYGATGQVDVIDGYLFEGEHVLIGEDGAPFLDPAKPKAYMVDGKFWVNNHAHILRSLGSNLFLCHYLNYIRYEGHVTGTTRLKLTKSALIAIPVLVPPINEQRRIVEKIEALFDEIDKGVESLAAAKAALGLYRQSLLKAAFEGRLTAGWRAQNPDKLEAPQTLLARIREEREARYKADLAAWQEAVEAWLERGEEGQPPSRPRAQKEVVPQHIIGDAPQVAAQEWAHTRLGDLSLSVSDGPFGSNLKTNDYTSSGVRVIRLENIGYGEFIEDKKSFISQEKYETIKKHTVSVGAIVVSSFVTDRVRSCIVPPSIGLAVNKADCFAVENRGEMVQSALIAYFLQSPQVYDQLEGLIHGVGRPRINTTQLKELHFPVCAPEEQAEIVRILDTRLDAADRLATEIDTALTRADALRQSILKRAFSGQLVPQDPTDEPASALLARIQQERAATSKKGKRKVSA